MTRLIDADALKNLLKNKVDLAVSFKPHSHVIHIQDLENLITNAPDAVNLEESLQQRIKPWMDTCFGAVISNDKLERGDRLLEGTLELLQSGNYPKERTYSLIEYTYNRPKGEPYQEVGGVMITLGAYCLAHGIDMHEAGETELARIWTKVEQIREKQKNKPTGSALPVVAPSIEEVEQEPYGYLCDWGAKFGSSRFYFYYDAPGSALEEDWNEYPKEHCNLPLYTNPPQPQTVRSALEKAAKIARDACLTLPDGGSPSDETIEACICAEKAILALIKKD